MGTDRLTDKVAIVTGAGSEISRATALLLASEGARVTVADIAGSAAAAFYGSHSLAAYGTSKAGVVAPTRYVATAYGERGIRCNAVAPGVVVARAAQDAPGGPMGDRLRRYSTSHLVGHDSRGPVVQRGASSS